MAPSYNELLGSLEQGCFPRIFNDVGHAHVVWGKWKENKSKKNNYFAPCNEILF